MLLTSVASISCPIRSGSGGWTLFLPTISYLTLPSFLCLVVFQLFFGRSRRNRAFALELQNYTRRRGLGERGVGRAGHGAWGVGRGAWGIGRLRAIAPEKSRLGNAFTSTQPIKLLAGRCCVLYKKKLAKALRSKNSGMWARLPLWCQR